MGTDRLRRFPGAFVLTAFLIVFAALPAAAVTTKDLASGVTASEILKVLTGAGVNITNVKVTGAGNAIGTFSGGTADGLSIEDGVILSTGDIKTAAGPNVAQDTTGALSTPGDVGLDEIVAPLKTQDAIIIEFDATTVSTAFSIRYIFASEEYQEFVGSEFNDVFAFFVDGNNIAVLPGTTVPVSVNTINHITNSGLYRDNPPNSNTFGSSFDGFTTELTAVAAVAPNVAHHIRILIADTSDPILDSAVFIARGGISGLPVATIVQSVNELLTTNLQIDDIDITVFGVPNNVTPKFTTSGLPEDSVVTFIPNGNAGPNTAKFKMHIVIGPDTPAGVYPLIIRANLGDSEAVGYVLVFVDCSAPIILGTAGHQPTSATADAAGRANLSVVPNGTLGFTYQWYQGHSGSTAFPIAGATRSTLTTPVVTQRTEFWVRVSNACGSRDSATAVVTPR